jgi:hypothetical protein
LRSGNAHPHVSTEVCWTSCELRLFIEEHIKGSANKSNGGDSTEDEDVVKLEPGAPLQSVQEETEFDEEKLVEDPRSQKQPIKPSKRSRVS